MKTFVITSVEVVAVEDDAMDAAEFHALYERDRRRIVANGQRQSIWHPGGQLVYSVGSVESVDVKEVK